MTDNLSREVRSRVMASIRGKDTKPELLLWKNLDHRAFRRYPRISGRPDIGNVSRKIAVFVDGCFWHGCPVCYRAPRTRQEYWDGKLLRNRANDRKCNESLERQGYAVLRFWEHEVKQDPDEVARKIMGAWSARKNKHS